MSRHVLTVVKQHERSQYQYLPLSDLVALVSWRQPRAIMSAEEAKATTEEEGQYMMTINFVVGCCRHTCVICGVVFIVCSRLAVVCHCVS